jgi:hypothetical protein
VARPGFSPRQEGVSDTHRPENSHPDSLLLFEIPLLFRHDRTSLMRAKSASACCVPGHRAQSTFFCRGDIAVVVGIRKIRAKGIVIFAGFPQKLCRPTVSIS